MERQLKLTSKYKEWMDSLPPKHRKIIGLVYLMMLMINEGLENPDSEIGKIIYSGYRG